MRSYKKIVFVNFRLRSDGNQFICWLPMHELFICQALRESGVAENASIYSLYIHEDIKDYYERWKDADLIIFWETYARVAPYVEDIITRAKGLKADMDIPVLFGGYWTTCYGEHFPEFRVFDAIFSGYSIDGVVERLVHGLAGGFVQKIHGDSNYDAYRMDLSFIATPLDRYVVFDTVQGYFSSFGCPNKCSFCINDLYRRLGAYFRPRPAQRIREDMSELARHIKFENVNFKDSNFFYNRERAVEILRFIREMGKNLSFNLDVTIADADEAFFTSMEGLFPEKNLFFGLESLISTERDVFGKPFSSEELLSFFRRAQEHGYTYSGNLMFGLPFQTRESMLEAVQEAVRLMREYENLIISVNAYIPKYGTSLQKAFFNDLHSRISLHKLILIYKSHIDAIQDEIYGERFKSIRFEYLKRSFDLLLAIKMLKVHAPPALSILLDLARWRIECHALSGARHPAFNAILKRINAVKLRRVLTRACIRYKKIKANLSGADR